ncbi:MAG: hypothetical protein Q7R57_08165 [Dehalococcoidales bacterium]|nr:hypothetical protein [Dehalococcoidales bacterium]
MAEFYALRVSATKVAFEGFTCLIESNSGWRVWAGFFASMAANTERLVDNPCLGVLVYPQGTRGTILQTWGISALAAQDWLELHIHCVWFCPILKH